MTKKQRIESAQKLMYKRCQNSLLEFAENFIFLDHPTQGRIRFKAYPFQRQMMLNDLPNNQFNVVLKSRQLGISVIASIYVLWQMTFEESKSIVIASPSLKVSKNIIKKIRRMHKGLPSYIKAKESYNNLTEVTFDNGSSVSAVSGSAEALRSEALSQLILDEAAFIDSAEEMMAAALPTLSTGGSALILSTPNGTSGAFYDMVEKGRKEDSIYNLIELPWTVHPDRDQKWRDTQTQLLGARKARQECDLEFLGSGNNFFIPSIIDKISRTIQSPIKVEDDGMKIYERPLTNTKYHLSIDVSRGDGEDYSYLNMLKVEGELRTQVAAAKIKIPTYKLDRLGIKWAKYYNNATIAVDITGIGYTVGSNIKEQYKYPNVIDYKGNPGVNIDKRNRPMMLDKLTQMIDDDLLIIRDGDFLDEANVFIWKNGKPQAAKGKNDDSILGVAIGIYTGYDINKFNNKKGSSEKKKAPLIFKGGYKKRERSIMI